MGYSTKSVFSLLFLLDCLEVNGSTYTLNCFLYLYKHSCKCKIRLLMASKRPQSETERVRSAFTRRPFLERRRLPKFYHPSKCKKRWSAVWATTWKGLASIGKWKMRTDLLLFKGKKMIRFYGLLNQKYLRKHLILIENWFAEIAKYLKISIFCILYWCLAILEYLRNDMNSENKDGSEFCGFLLIIPY